MRESLYYFDNTLPQFRDLAHAAFHFAGSQPIVEERTCLLPIEAPIGTRRTQTHAIFLHYYSIIWCYFDNLYFPTYRFHDKHYEMPPTIITDISKFGHNEKV